jgi:two-component system sensor histidine kinase PrrB
MQLRLATRTGLASLVAAAITLVAVGAVFQGSFETILRDRVDRQLQSRSDTAPILAAVADRLSRSELRATVEGARVQSLTSPESGVIEIGLLPTQPLPPVAGPGFSTARADGQAWRLLTIDVVDVPRVGDHALVQLASPLGDVDAQAVSLRRRALVLGMLAALAAGIVGYLFGLVASKPLVTLAHDTGQLADLDPDRWRVRPSYGSPEVDEVASALNSSLERVADETRLRAQALASARAFASSVNHELRTPLQSALTNLDMASTNRIDPAAREHAIATARDELARMAASLSAVGALADAELVEAGRFELVALGDVIDEAVSGEARRLAHARLELEIPDDAAPVRVWRHGVVLAVANLLRNAVVHGAPVESGPVIAVRVNGTVVRVDDNGPGIAEADRTRVLARFERGQAVGATNGSGLGLALVDQVARAHGGRVEIGASPSGGTRVTLWLAPDEP